MPGDDGCLRVYCLLYTHSPNGARNGTGVDDGQPPDTADAGTAPLPDAHPGSIVWHLDSTVTYSGMDPDIQRSRERLLEGEVPSNRMPQKADQD